MKKQTAFTGAILGTLLMAAPLQSEAFFFGFGGGFSFGIGGWGHPYYGYYPGYWRRPYYGGFYPGYRGFGAYPYYAGLPYGLRPLYTIASYPFYAYPVASPKTKVATPELAEK